MTARDLLDLVLLGLVWGASFLFMRIAVPEFGPFALVELRVAIAALVLMPVVMLRRQGADVREHWKTLLIIGAHNTALPFLLFAFATLTLSAGIAGILNATAPIFTAAVAWLWLGKKLNLSRAAGLLVGVLGVCLLVGNKISAPGNGYSLAVLAALCASLLYGIAGNYTQQKAAHIAPMVIAAGSQLFSALLLLPVAIATWPSTMPSASGWIAIILMGLFSTGLAYILYFRLIANVGPTNAITVTYLIPVFAMILGALVLDEAVTLPMVLGCGVILIGTALATGMLRLPNRRSNDDKSDHQQT